VWRPHNLPGASFILPFQLETALRLFPISLCSSSTPIRPDLLSCRNRPLPLLIHTQSLQSIPQIGSSNWGGAGALDFDWNRWEERNRPLPIPLLPPRSGRPQPSPCPPSPKPPESMSRHDFFLLPDQFPASTELQRSNHFSAPLPTLKEFGDDWETARSGKREVSFCYGHGAINAQTNTEASCSLSNSRVKAAVARRLCVDLWSG
jgi:hypothetical protein